MQNASVTLTAIPEVRIKMKWPVRRCDVPQPRTPPILIAQTMAHGTAVAAFEDSSDMWTVESNEPARYVICTVAIAD